MIRAKWESLLSGAQVSPSGVTMRATPDEPSCCCTAFAWSVAKLFPAAVAGGTAAGAACCVVSGALRLSTDRITDAK